MFVGSEARPRRAPPGNGRTAWLPGGLAAMTCYFNPCGYRLRRRHYERFADGLAAQGVPLFTAELAFDGRPFELEKGPGVERFRSGHVLWHKERLLNLLLRRVPEQYDKIAWIDADVLFEKAEWPAEAARRLEEVPVVQLFEEVLQLDRDDQPGESRWSVAWGHARDGARAGQFGQYHPGFAWAARRELLEEHGLLDNHVLGGADSVMACAMFGWWRHPLLLRYHGALRQPLLAWGRAFWEDVRGRVGCVPGRIRHLWHGRRADRRYVERIGWLAEAQFDPARHLRRGANGLWEWDAGAEWLAGRVRRYFRDRREDG